MSPAATDPVDVLRVTSATDDDAALSLLRADDRLTVTSATDADAALARVREGSVDCVVADHDPAVTDGLALLAAVRDLDPVLPVVLLDNSADASVASAAVDHDVTAYVPTADEEWRESLADRVITAVDDDRARRLRRYETILESLDDGVYAIEPDGTIVYVNERYAEMKGVDRERLIGTDIYEWVSDETAEKARAAREEMARGDREVGVVEYEFSAVDGEGFPAEMRFARVPGGDAFDRVGVIRDITERKEREQSLRRKNERLDRFASIVSHDLRNPLNVLSGSLDLVEQTDDPAHIERCKRAVDRMETLIDDLLAVAREGFDIDATVPIELEEIVEHAWESVDDPAATLSIEPMPRIRADRARLVQLLENLFRNAVEHGSTNDRTEAGDPTTTKADGDDEQPTDEGVVVTVGVIEGGFFVEDNGPGIPVDEREAIFEFGYSAGGTGIGLAVVEQIADAHGWSVNVTESSTGGARFEFRGVDLVESRD